jgi:exopolysaccharide biosynthesis polyprenyl glycosylphosphotransferase
MSFSPRSPFGARIAAVVTLDAASLCLAALVALAWSPPPVSLATFALATGVVAIGALLVLQATGAYDLTTIGSGPRTRVSLLTAMGIGFALALLVHAALPTSPGTTDVLLHSAAVFFPLFLLERRVFRSVSKRMRKRILLVGHSDLSGALTQGLEQRRDMGLEIVGLLCGDAESPARQQVDGIPVLGPIHHLEKAMNEEVADWVVVTSRRRDEVLPEDQLLSLKLRGVPISSGLRLYERITGEVYHDALRSSVLIFDEGFGMGPIDRFVKRALDVVVASLALVLLAPILLASAIAIRLDSKGSIFFRQTRVGQFRKPFQLVKLRTMREGAEQETGPCFATRDDLRITRVGRFLRRTRIDELPQFWSVLKGEMSVVGPRPERPEFLDEISQRYPYFRLRLAYKPGVTGWAQVRHGYVADLDGFSQKLALDLYYMRNHTLSMDLSILWATVRTVFSLGGV